MSFTEIIFWLIYGGGLLAALKRPAYAVYIYIMIYAICPDSQWWGQRIASLGLRTSLIAALAAMAGTVFSYKRLSSTQSQFPWMIRLSMVYLIYAFCTSMTDEYPFGDDFSQKVLFKLAKIIVFVMIMIRAIRTLEEFRWVLWSWMVGAIYIGYQAWSGVGIEINGRLSAGLGGSDFGDSSGLAVHMTAMIGIAGFLFYSSYSYRAKFFALLAAAFSMNTIVLTRTRNAFPGIIVMVIFGMMRLPRGLRLKCGVGVMFGMLLSLQLTDDGWWRRMETLKKPDEDPSIISRYDYWRAAREMANENIFGVGPGQFRVRVSQYLPDLSIGRSAHSTYFECLAELGYPGLTLFLMIIAVALWTMERCRAIAKSWRERMQSDPQLGAKMRELLLVATANEVSLVGFLVCGAFTTRLWTEGLWMLLGMGCCIWNVAQEIRQEIYQVADQPVRRVPAPASTIIGLPSY